ncbi:hypothetical protein K435DRAFT_789900 [Dendrothele bispora CBS 962.96]|uniref:Uncharacterized protein n=1 Tax=Dendrothele bispora (strain CBS 962.96) TaxID=1314807 RepID=A0A4S8MU14_DENBC|nr:hypothetical protein K435DRAFT_789900 [Dendrothele bispora CBS 962.96]
MAPIQKRDIISFTLDNKREITVTWSQNLSSKSEPYYAIPAKNTSSGADQQSPSCLKNSQLILYSFTSDIADVNFFLQKNWFDNELNKFATVNDQSLISDLKSI